MTRTSQIKDEESKSQLIAEIVKVSLQRPKKNIIAKNIMLRIKENKAACLGRLDDVVIVYPGNTLEQKS